MSARLVTIAAIVAGIALSTGLPAASLMSKPDYQAARKGIAADARIVKAACASSKAEGRHACMKDAGMKKNVALAQLEESYRPSDRTRKGVVAANVKAARATALSP
jgi:hypothetical protein